MYEVQHLFRLESIVLIKAKRRTYVFFISRIKYMQNYFQMVKCVCTFISIHLRKDYNIDINE